MAGYALDRAAPHTVRCTSGGAESGDEPKKLPAHFYRSERGAEPVRDWLQSLNREDRKRIGADIATVEYGWPVGMPTCRPLGSRLWEVRTDLEYGRIARVLFCLVENRMVLLHGFVKKNRKTPGADLELARRRMKEVAR
jgi:phage-related protein